MPTDNDSIEDLRGAPTRTVTMPTSDRGSEGVVAPSKRPVGYIPDYDTPDYIGNTDTPGYHHTNMAPINGGLSKDDYFAWFSESMKNTTFARMRESWGAGFVAFSWYAYRTQMDDNAYFNGLTRRFGDAASLGGGGGGSYGGGGGGGVSQQQQYDNAYAAIKNQIKTIGLDFSDEQIHAIAKTAVDANWSGDMVTDYILEGKTLAEGTYQSTIAGITGMAKQQLITMSDATAKEWAKKVLSGEMDVSAIQTIMQQQAMAEFGWASEALKGGASMRDILMPARDTIARELEMNPEDIDFMDGQWRKMAQTTGADGTVRGATMTEVIQQARKDKRFASTANAARGAAGVATLLRQVFEGG